MVEFIVGLFVGMFLASIMFLFVNGIDSDEQKGRSMTKEDFMKRINEDISKIEEESEFLIDELKYFKNNITNENRDFIYEDIQALMSTLVKLNRYLKKIYIKRRN